MYEKWHGGATAAWPKQIEDMLEGQTIERVDLDDTDLSQTREANDALTIYFVNGTKVELRVMNSKIVADITV